MAELVVSMAIGPLVSMLRDKASSYLLDQYNVMEGMEEQHKTLKRKLPAILDIITYAEELATAQMEGAKAWLQELKMVAYAANEVFDEFKYEALRREAKKNGHYRKLGFDGIKLFPTHNRVEFRRRMGGKLCRILRDIEVLIEEMQAFGFKYQPQPQPPVSKQWRQTDYVIIDPQEIARRSRDKEKKNIVDILLGQASNADLAVVPIVGMGGLGKTTLAQLIYNEPEIQKHFQLLLWVCVSDTFDVNSVAKSIVEASPKKNDDIHKPPLERLQELVSGQRYLLVLDDVWNNKEFHKWERLKVCLQHGGTGCAVLTTTRDKRVAEIMCADRTYPLNDLEDRFLKEIIEAKAFSSEKEKPTELVEMVDEIVKRCSGSPLAATALGSVLRTKTSVNEWKIVSSRSSICTEETGILPILKLSYNDLPSHMKQCFAFCAVFPKDYKINVEKLILLWIANGFIPEHKEDSPETVGKHIFNDLASRSFFLEEYKGFKEYYSRTTCKIHDLMHDIAMSVMEKECVVATEKPSKTEWLLDTARHLYLSCKETEGILNDSMKKRSPAIQTLLCDSYMGSPLQHMSKYSSLHALKLYLRRDSFPLEPKYMHHLRYLDLSKSDIKELPEDISILYNLQMLDLSNCYYLNRLPRQMKYMTSLRHLYTHGCKNLKSMPPELGKLNKLQTLTCFVAAVSGPDSSDVTELEHLNLGGQLELCQLEYVIEAEAKVANLGKKKDLRELTLRWTSVCDSEVLNNFEPHDGLQVMRIYSYGGKCTGMLQNMVEIHLSHCERLQFLFRRSTYFTFPKLKQLRLENLFNFERWWEIDERQGEHKVFPVLEKLFIMYCGKLVALPEAPFLKEPCTGGGYSLVRSAFPALKVLKMEELGSFQRWDGAVEGGEILFPLLEELSIEKCPRMIALPKASLIQKPYSGGYRLVHPPFPLLDKFFNRYSRKLIALPEVPCSGNYRSAFPALKVLNLGWLETFQRWDGAVEGGEILFPLLEELSIEKCPRMIALPKAPLIQKPYSGGYRLVHPPFPLLDKFFNRYSRKLIALPEVPCSGNYRSAFPALKVLNLGWLETFQRWDAAVEGEEISFPQLEKLSVWQCPMLIALPEAPLLQEPCNGGYWSAFPALKVLKMTCLENFQRWDARVEGKEILFPFLEELSIEICPKLIDFPEAPKLSVLKIDDGKQEFFHCVDKYLPSLTKLILRLGNSETTSGADWTTIVLVDSKEIRNLKSPLTIMKLRRCNLFFVSGALELWCCFVRLEDLEIDSADMLVHWPEEVFQSLVSLRRLVIKQCKNLIGYAQARPEPSASKRNQHLPGLEVLELLYCASLVEMFNVPASLKNLKIDHCPKLESIFSKQQLQGMSELVQGSFCSEAITHTAVSELSSSPINHFCPLLEDLSLRECGSLPAVLNLPPSLKTISIALCSNIQVLSCQLDELPRPQVTASINVPDPSAAAAAREHSLPPYLESLAIVSCAGMLRGILRLPMSLKYLLIVNNSGFTSIESLSAEHPPSLELLALEYCSTLASLPNQLQAYRSLFFLLIIGCPAIKKLPRCLQQQLGNISDKALDAQYEVMAFKPKTWKEIPRLVRERKEAKRKAEQSRQANHTIQEQETG